MPIDPRSGAVLAQLLADAFKALDSDIDRVRASLSRAVALVDATPPQAVARGEGGLAAWQARKISALIEASLEDGVRIADLATALRLSKSHFSRAFKVHFGRPPQQYILERRIARAQHLMLMSDRRLCEVALACGFTDQAHLSRVFRRRVGAAPNAWRRACLGLRPG
jgi:transcriptional regulator GlxA family with amidase domain